MSRRGEAAGRQRGGSAGKSAGVPKGWPAGVRFTDRLEWTAASRQRAATAAAEATAARAVSLVPLRAPDTPMRGPNPNVAVKVIDDPAHPAHGQRGLFAARAIPPRTNIIDYIGAVCAPIAAPDAPSASAQGEQQSVSGHPVPGVLLSSVDLAAETSDYCLAFHSGLSIDAQHAGNEARFFNDYRGVGGSVKRPNVAFEIYRDARLVPRASSAALLGLGDALVGARDVPVHMQAMSMGVWSLNEKIPKGTELLINYGKGFWRARTSYAPDAAEETE